MKKHHLSLSITLSLATLLASGAAQAAENADTTLAQLQAQLTALQQQVNALKQKKQASSEAGEPEQLTTQQDGEAQADEAESTEHSFATQSELEGFRTDLENYKYDDARQYERSTVKATRDTNLYGTVQVRAQAQSTDTTSGNPAPNSERRNTFDIPTALIGVRGNLYKDYKEGKNLDYQLSFSYGKRTGTAGSASDLNLADAFLRYNFTSTNGGPEIPRLNVTLGQQLIPFGLDPQSPEDLRPTINVATGLAQLGLFNRQTGLVVRGDVKPFVDYSANYRAPLFEYALGVINGNGTNKVDDNDSKDYIGRVAFTLPVDYASWLRELKFGASYLKGSKNVSSGTSVLDKDGRNDRLGFDIYYNHAPFGITYEYVKGLTDYATAAGNTSEVKSEGHTATVFYTLGDQFYNSVKSAAKFDDFWPKSIQTFYRYDTYNPNKSADVVGIAGNGLGKVDIHTLGFNLFFAQTTKFQFGINRWTYDHKTATQKDFTEAQAQFQYTF
ncbi:MAG: DUF3138 domain-containing protein [Moraxellaceae bacterium]|nr:DUF3138 domain-containing protein [Moraxellaceae bacterium]